MYNDETARCNTQFTERKKKGIEEKEFKTIEQGKYEYVKMRKKEALCFFGLARDGHSEIIISMGV